MSLCSFTAPALHDLEEIHDHIAADTPTTAARWIERIEEGCRKLADMPGIGRGREELAAGLHSFTVGAYVIFYREVEDGVQIVRVLHGARDIDALFP
jgi:toxin ParE1/3/4